LQNTSSPTRFWQDQTKHRDFLTAVENIFIYMNNANNPRYFVNANSYKDAYLHIKKRIGIMEPGLLQQKNI